MDDHFPGLPLLVICLICLFIFCLKKLTKYLYLRKTSSSNDFNLYIEEDSRTRIAIQAYFVDMHAEIIAERMNKSSEKPPKKLIYLPPTKYEDIVIWK